jgi:hypothetical protein
MVALVLLLLLLVGRVKDGSVLEKLWGPEAAKEGESKTAEKPASPTDRFLGLKPGRCWGRGCTFLMRIGTVAAAAAAAATAAGPAAAAARASCWFRRSLLYLPWPGSTT